MKRLAFTVSMDKVASSDLHLMVTNHPRTSVACWEALQAALRDKGLLPSDEKRHRHLFPFVPGNSAYYPMLHVASTMRNSRIVMTADSVSMLSEVLTVMPPMSVSALQTGSMNDNHKKAAASMVAQGLSYEIEPGKLALPDLSLKSKAPNDAAVLLSKAIKGAVSRPRIAAVGAPGVRLVGATSAEVRLPVAGGAGSSAPTL